MSDITADFMIGYRTEEQQAALLGKTVRTLRTWRKARIGPAWTRTGKDVLYNDDWTAAWLLAQKQEPVRKSRHRNRRRSDEQATGSAA
jgi:hypothetical protein